MQYGGNPPPTFGPDMTIDEYIEVPGSDDIMTKVRNQSPRAIKAVLQCKIYFVYLVYFIGEFTFVNNYRAVDQKLCVFTAFICKFFFLLLVVTMEQHGVLFSTLHTYVWHSCRKCFALNRI